jgi:hypothetical protein
VLAVPLEHHRTGASPVLKSTPRPISGHARDTLAADGTPEESADTTFSLQKKYPGRDSNPHGHEGPMAFEAIVSDQFHHPGGSRHMIWTMP